MLHFVYAEVDPRTDIPFYVGITNNPNQRHAEHLKRNEHIKQMCSEAVTPYMKILEIVSDKKDVLRQERHWVQEYLSQGIQLINVRLTKPMPLPYPEPTPLSERCLTDNQIYTLEQVEEVLSLLGEKIRDLADEGYIKKAKVLMTKSYVYVKQSVDAYAKGTGADELQRVY